MVLDWAKLTSIRMTVVLHYKLKTLSCDDDTKMISIQRTSLREMWAVVEPYHCLLLALKEGRKSGSFLRL